MRKQMHIFNLLLYTTMVGMFTAFNHDFDLGLSNLCYAQEPERVKQELFREIIELFDQATIEGISTFSPKNFSLAEEVYQQALKSYERGRQREDIKMQLFQAKTHLGMAFEAAKNVKAALEDMIVLRSEALKLTIREPARSAFETAESILQRAILQAETGNITTAKRIAQEAETGYRDAILNSLKEGPFTEAEGLLAEVKVNITPEQYDELTRKLAEAEELHAEAQVPRISSREFLELIAQIMNRIHKVLDLAEVEVELSELPDLTIEELAFSPETPDVNEDLEVSAVIRNVGSIRAENIPVQFLNCSRDEIGQFIIDYLEPGEVKVVKITTMAREYGECFVAVEVDPESRIVETNEENNNLQGVISVEVPFFEKYPAWNMSDPVITSLVIDPESVKQGETIICRARVSNLGKGKAQPASLTFLFNDQPFYEERIDTLYPAEDVEVNASLIAEEPGHHQIAVQLEIGANDFDRTFDNNFQVAKVHIYGEAANEPYLDVDLVEFGSLPRIENERRTATVRVRNLGFVDVQNFPVQLCIDHEPVAKEVIEYLYAGEEQELYIPYSKITTGEHLIEVQLGTPAEFPDPKFQPIKSWHFTMPDQTVLYSTFVKDTWVSLGPQILKNGSVGRLHVIALHPTNPKIVYVGAPTCGLWKTTNGGNSWTPLTDKLPSMYIGAIAVDPKYPDIVYIVTGSSTSRDGVGIFKSLDGGKKWHLFATHALEVIDWKSQNTVQILGANGLEIRYPSSNEVMIYAATNTGLLRYKSKNPKTTKSSAKEWIKILNGVINDMVVAPENDSLVYASVNYYRTIKKKKELVFKGLFRTRKGVIATGIKYYTYWTRLTKGLPKLMGKKGYGAVIDIEREQHLFSVLKGDHEVLYTAIRRPGGIDIYSTEDGGDSWKYQLSKNDKGFNVQYNPFIRIVPGNNDAIYFGGVKLYRAEKQVSYGYGPASHVPMGYKWYVEKISSIHVDQHGMVFIPAKFSLFPTSTYYILNDGGIWRCKRTKYAFVGGWYDQCLSRNNELRTTQIYDFDGSRTDPKLMLAGTQDNGTILYDGKSVWRGVKGGDGNFSLIGPGNKIFYAQHQFLHGDWGTDRCEQGVNCGHKSWYSAKNGLPKGQPWYMGNAYITVHPKDPKYLLSQGDEVYATWDGGNQWVKKGPKGSKVKGYVKRVVFQPKTSHWFAGTSKGQVWYTTNAGVSWTLLDSHPDKYAYVTNMVFAPTNHKVLYVTYNGSDAYRRIQRFELNPNDVWTSTWIASATWQSGSLPTQHIFAQYPTIKRNVDIRAIAVDGYNENIVYVGTQKGVFRGEASCGNCNWSWKPYNKGLPYVIINDLIVDPTSKQLRAATYGRGVWSVITGP